MASLEGSIIALSAAQKGMIKSLDRTQFKNVADDLVAMINATNSIRQKLGYGADLALTVEKLRPVSREEKISRWYKEQGINREEVKPNGHEGTGG